MPETGQNVASKFKVSRSPRSASLALTADLNKAKGFPMRKTCAVLHDCFGL
jgi:hypothetical protein